MPTDLTWITDQLATGGVTPTVPPARVMARMVRERVDLVIDCRAELDDSAAWRGAPVEYLRLPTFDVPSWWIPPEHFDRAVEAARPVLDRGGRVFVHCFLGHNRGPSTALALLLDGGMEYDAAVDLIRARRPVASLAYALDAYDAHVTRGRPVLRRRLAAAAELPHDHFGEHGAAGVLLVATRGGRRRVLLQLRSAYVAAGGTWSVPGGALAAGETPEEAALRELREELGVSADRVQVVGRHVARCPRSACDGWTYTTLVGRLSPVPRRLSPGWETDATLWVDVAEVQQLLGDALHPAFAQAWPALRRLVARA